MSRIPSSEERRNLAEILYETWTEEPGDEFYYDKKHDLFRFPDGEFAFSRVYVVFTSTSRAEAGRHPVRIEKPRQLTWQKAPEHGQLGGSRRP